MKTFLSYNSKNRTFVQIIADALKRQGVEVFFDVESIDIGDKWNKVIEEGIAKSQSALVFIGEEGIGGWQNKEILKILTDKGKKEGYRVIPILLPSNNGLAQENLPWHLADYQWIEFKNGVEEIDNFALQKLLAVFQNDPISEPSQRENYKGIPYKGLRSYEVEDAFLFFGRMHDLNIVFHDALKLHYGVKNNNFLAIVGDSGTGKSSFAKAGILAALKNGQFEGSENWKQIIIKPGTKPLEQLSEALKVNDILEDSAQFEKDVLEKKDVLARKIRETRIKDEKNEDEKPVWVLYIDQFEELIVQCNDKIVRKAFLSNLVRAVEEENFICLCSLRTDYYDKFSAYKDFNQLLRKNNYPISKIAIDKDEKEDENAKHLIRKIITEPAAFYHVKIHNELVNTIVEDLRKVTGPLPILQLCMQKLWNAKDGSEIGLKEYSKISKNRSIAGIIENHANNAYNRYTNNGKDADKVALFKKIFISNLITVVRTGEDVRRTALKSEINPDDDDGINKMLDNLISEDGRLLVAYKKKGENFIDVVHEVIIREWSLLKKWVDKRRDALIYKERIEGDAEKWAKNKDKIILYRFNPLEAAIKWRKGNRDLCTPLIQKFIQDSEKEKNRDFGLAFGLALVFFALMFLFLNQNNRKILEEKKIEYEKMLFLETLQRLNPEIKDLNVDKLYIKNEFFIMYLENGNVNKYLKNLTDLRFYRLRSLTSLSVLANLDSLEALYLYRLDSLTSLTGLANLNNLETLSLSNLNALTSLTELANLSQIKSLTITNVSSKSGDWNLSISEFEKLKKIKELDTLKLYGWRNYDLDFLKEYHKYVEIDKGWRR